ncbi:hypothetical protein V5O48_008508 [Marasmius crinis-equi]|uniref:G domain-containing protein n=1 Tax=Marasmius crinis-equi TaxID=585013 RepID=A0ABR3FDW2_9AGAR
MTGIRLNPRPVSITEDTAVVMVAGVTGSGKTTANVKFINTSSGSKLLVTDSLQSGSPVIQSSPYFSIDGRPVVLLDTPGFDESTHSDATIVSAIATVLAELYRDGQRLAGILYFHRISDVRVGRASMGNIQLFGKLCGEDFFKNVMIVTNRWEDVPLNLGEAREMELRQADIFFKPILDRGGRMARFDGTHETAHAILGQVVENRPLPLLIQTELVDSGKDIAETSAGAALNRELQVLAKIHERTLGELQNELKEAFGTPGRLSDTRREMEAEMKRLEVDITHLQARVESMSRDYTAQKARFEQQLVAAKRIADEEQKKLHTRMQSLRTLPIGQQRRNSVNVQTELEDLEERDRMRRSQRFLTYLFAAIRVSVTLIPLCLHLADQSNF